jgi:sec-independent protein translocase protein TatA
MSDFSIWHWMIVIVVVMLLFGRSKVSDLMGNLAQGVKAFKKAMSEDEKPVETRSDAPSQHQVDRSSPTAEPSGAPR